MKIDHISIAVGEHFVKEKVDKITVFLCNHDQKMLVQRVCCALVICPAWRALSHTLQKTWNFSILLRLCEAADSAMTLSSWVLVTGGSLWYEYSIAIKKPLSRGSGQL